MKKILISLLFFTILFSGCSTKVEYTSVDQLVEFKEYKHEYAQSQGFSLDELGNGMKMEVKIPQIKIKTPEISSFNEEMNKLYEEWIIATYREKLDENGEKILTSAWISDSNAYLEQEILSIIVYTGSVIWGSSLGDVHIKTYNYSLKEKKFVTNEELFNLLNLNIEEQESKLSEILTENYIKNTVLNGEKISEYNPEYEDCIYYEITDDSTIYLNDGIHYIIQGYSGVNKKNYDIKLEVKIE